MPTSVKFRLGGKEFELPALFNIRELRDISVASVKDRDETAPADKKEAWLFDSTAHMIYHALLRKYPEVTIDEVYLAETTLAEVLTARLIILKHTNLYNEEKSKSPGGVDEGA